MHPTNRNIPTAFIFAISTDLMFITFYTLTVDNCASRYCLVLIFKRIIAVTILKEVYLLQNC